jgi:hypothetical protein
MRNDLHQKLRDDVLKVIAPYKESLTAMEILALLSYTVGQAIAFQDQTKYSAYQCMDVVSKNIEKGNYDAINNSFSGLDAGIKQ